MADSRSKEMGIIATLVERLETQRLPRALELRELVERGERLSELDLQFLERVFSEARQILGQLDRYPEWQPLAAKMMGLYKEITERALANEQASGRGKP